MIKKHSSTPFIFRLVAYNEERGELVVETFRFPSCCSCMLHRGLGF